MASIVRLEPRTDCPEMQDSLQARIHDPLWLLARQWQFGEFKGDDAGSPAAAQLTVKSAPISRFHPGPLPADPAQAKANSKDYSPQNIPLSRSRGRPYRRWFAALCEAGRTSKRCGAGSTVHRVTF